jgi:hypothetical protein
MRFIANLSLLGVKASAGTDPGLFEFLEEQFDLSQNF